MICSSFRLDTELTTYTKATKATPGACAPSAHHTQTHTYRLAFWHAHCACWWDRVRLMEASTLLALFDIQKVGQNGKNKRKRRGYVLDTAGTVEKLWWLWILFFFLLNSWAIQQVLPRWCQEEWGASFHVGITEFELSHQLQPACIAFYFCSRLHPIGASTVSLPPWIPVAPRQASLVLFEAKDNQGQTPHGGQAVCPVEV